MQASPKCDTQPRALSGACHQECAGAFTEAAWLAAYFAAPAQPTVAMRAAPALSDQLVRELVDADELVIGTRDCCL
jgi:FMN-dependent NADH-azoreductase